MAISDLAKRLKTAVKSNKHASILSNKPRRADPIMTTDVPMLNVASSGDLYGGPMVGGITQIVGDSKCFKTGFALLHGAAYLEKYDDAMIVFFDSEGGANYDFFELYNIDMDRVLNIPITDVEELKQQIMQILSALDGSEHVIFIIDSLGLLASRKETEDAINEKTVADMTRAKGFTSFWRMVTTKLKLYGYRMFAINHYYDTMSMFPTKVVKGGKAGELASDEIWFISRSKIKTSDNKTSGFKFTITLLKSRTCREDSKIPIEITFDGFIDKLSGLLEVARATGHVLSEKKGWYTRSMFPDDKSWRKYEMNEEWWAPILADESFQEAVRTLYLLNSRPHDATETLETLLNDEDIDPETGEILE